MAEGAEQSIHFDLNPPYPPIQSVHRQNVSIVPSQLKCYFVISQ